MHHPQNKGSTTAWSFSSVGERSGSRRVGPASGAAAAAARPASGIAAAGSFFCLS